jgi:magnesium chelatase subunit I
MEVSDEMPSSAYQPSLQAIPGLQESVAVLKDGDTPAAIASAVEFVLEGLHLHQQLNKERCGGRLTYRV